MDMRKTIILAIATMFLAGASVVTGLARTAHNPIGETISARPVVHPLTTGSLTARVVPAT
jgi:hypothetical protein